MKRFGFNLEKILKLRKFSEEQAKNELGKALGILAGIENNIKLNAQTRYNASQKRFSSVSTNHLNPESSLNSIIQWDLYIARLDQEKEELLEKAAQAELVVEEKREIYMNASRDLKVMEKLKEKQFAQYKKEYQAHEIKTMDDLYRAR